MRREDWVRIGGIGALGIAAILTQGCTTRGTITPARTANVIGDYAASSAAALLNVQVVASAVSGDAPCSAVAAKVKGAVDGALAAQDFALNASKPDVRVDIATEATLFDQSGSYFKYNGKTDTSVRRVHDQKLLAHEVATASGERRLGQPEALDAVAGKLATDTAAQVVQACAPLKTKLAANDITVKRPFMSLRKNDPAYAEAFVARVARMEGVLACTLVDQSYEQQTMVFRIVYYRDTYPQGLLNRLALVKELQIQPSK